MGNNIFRVLSVVSVLCLFSGCGQTGDPLSWGDYQQWLHGESSGLKKVKRVNDINISAQFLPAEYLAFRDLERDRLPIDSLNYKRSKSHYECGLTFRILVQPEQGGVNLLYHKVYNEATYNQRVQHLSFKADQYISMKVGDQEYQPVLASYEGYNEMLNRLIFTTVFQPEEFSCGKFQGGTESITIKFDDPFWSTGVNNFTYGISSLTDVPKIILN